MVAKTHQQRSGWRVPHGAGTGQKIEDIFIYCVQLLRMMCYYGVGDVSDVWPVHFADLTVACVAHPTTPAHFRRTTQFKQCKIDSFPSHAFVHTLAQNASQRCLIARTHPRSNERRNGASSRHTRFTWKMQTEIGRKAKTHTIQGIPVTIMTRNIFVVVVVVAGAITMRPIENNGITKFRLNARAHFPIIGLCFLLVFFF